MTFKKYELSILSRVIILFIVLTIEAYFVVNSKIVYAIMLSPVVIYQVVNFYLFHKRAQREVEEFVEAIHYREKSR